MKVIGVVPGSRSLWSRAGFRFRVECGHVSVIPVLEPLKIKQRVPTVILCRC